MIKVNLGLCIGCGTCESMCPDCFEINDDGKSHVKENCSESCCDLGDIVTACPVAAITVE
ncbi:MAG: ferredoxin [Patescibacteria group bacterium]|nr:ferredoxin [Patescibacteria group bacterium]